MRSRAYITAFKTYYSEIGAVTRNGETIFNECHSQRTPSVDLRSLDLISTIALNAKRGDIRARCRFARCTNTYFRSSLFGTGPGFDPIRMGSLFTIGCAAAFSDDTAETRRSTSSVPIRSLPNTSCVLFAYFVLRTRRGCPRYFRRPYVSPASPTRSIDVRCRCNLVRIYEGIAQRSNVAREKIWLYQSEIWKY